MTKKSHQKIWWVKKECFVKKGQSGKFSERCSEICGCFIGLGGLDVPMWTHVHHACTSYQQIIHCITHPQPMEDCHHSFSCQNQASYYSKWLPTNIFPSSSLQDNRALRRTQVHVSSFYDPTGCVGVCTVPCNQNAAGSNLPQATV